MDTNGRASRETAAEITTLNKATLARLIEALPPDAAQSLRMEYNRKAYPNIYNDSRSAEPHLKAALALEDLSPQQRSQIAEMTQEYRAAYDQLCDQLVELMANASANGFPGFGGPGGGPGGGGRNGGAAGAGGASGGAAGSGGGGGQRDMQSWQQQQRALEKVNFDRDELSDNALARLRAALNDEQTQRGLRDEKNQ